MAKAQRRKIPLELVPLAYQTAKQVFSNSMTRADGIKIIVGSDRMNENSAADYIDNYKALVQGKQFERKLNTFSMDYYFSSMLKDSGRSFLDNPLNALQSHINYNLTEQNANLPGMQRLHDRYANLTNIPELVENREQIEKNLVTFSGYLEFAQGADLKELHNSIKLGIDLIYYPYEDGFQFAPAKFVSWRENTLCRFGKKQIHGTDAVERLKVILGKPLKDNKFFEKRFQVFCQQYNIPISATGTGNNKRKFWNWDIELVDQGTFEIGFPEGKRAERLHKYRERNSELVRLAKKLFKEKHGSLFCQACNINFEKTYGKVGEDFIEAHHIIPVHTMEDAHISKVEDMAMLCSNCHRMVHRKRPWLSMSELSTLLL